MNINYLFCLLFVRLRIKVYHYTFKKFFDRHIFLSLTRTIDNNIFIVGGFSPKIISSRKQKTELRRPTRPDSPLSGRVEMSRRDLVETPISDLGRPRKKRVDRPQLRPTVDRRLCHDNRPCSVPERYIISEGVLYHPFRVRVCRILSTLCPCLSPVLTVRP